MSINREFYHRSFMRSLVDMYDPIMIDLMHRYFQYACTIKVAEREPTAEECVSNFKTLLQEKCEVVKRDPQKAYDALMNSARDLSKLVSVASINYRRLHSTDGNLSVKKITDKDLFECVFICVCREIFRHGMLFLKVDSPQTQYYNSLKIEDLVHRAVKKGVHETYEMMFIDGDRLKSVENLEIKKDGKILPLDIKKLVEMFEREGIDMDQLVSKLEDQSSEASSESGSDKEDDEGSSSSSSSGSESDEEGEVQVEGIPILTPTKIDMSNRDDAKKQIVFTL